LCSAMTDKNRQKKEAEGDQKMKEADKMASSGFFKKPDWIGALETLTCSD
jgi:hypothetical protein